MVADHLVSNAAAIVTMDCRICFLTVGPFINIIEDNPRVIDLAGLEKLFRVRIHAGDGLSHYLCIKCLDKFITCGKFLRNIKKKRILMRALYSKLESEDTEDTTLQQRANSDN